jgi:hypothetical protein
VTAAAAAPAGAGPDQRGDANDPTRIVIAGSSHLHRFTRLICRVSATCCLS